MNGYLVMKIENERLRIERKGFCEDPTYPPCFIEFDME